jgi:hypothetical protein
MGIPLLSLGLTLEPRPLHIPLFGLEFVNAESLEAGSSQVRIPFHSTTTPFSLSLKRFPLPPAVSSNLKPVREVG